MTRHRPASEPRYRPRRRSSERGISGADKLQQMSRPYYLEWSAQNCRQKGILDAEDLREHMEAGERPGWRRMVVMRGECDMGVVLGMEMEKSRTRGWTWEFPETEKKKRSKGSEGEGNGKGDGDDDDSGGKGDDEGIRICRASLLIKNRLPILLLDGLPSQIPSRPYRPSLGSRPPSTTTHPESVSHSKRPPHRSELENALWQALVDTRPLEDLLAEIMYDAWLEALDSLPPLGDDSVDVQWTIARALETNADATRCMERRGEFSTITSADWTYLSERLQRRIQLSATIALSIQSQQARDEPPDTNSRSLDRITYLGGLLLPLTVVSGILSIEGTYGPEGSAFWVFWLASGLCSIIALLVIYADRLRTLDVWMEVAAGEVLDGLDLDNLHRHGSSSRYQASSYTSHSRSSRRRESNHSSNGDPERGEAKYTTASDGGVYVVQQRGDGSRGKAWRKKELGWLGAAKKMCGWYRWRGSPGLEFRMPGWEEKMKGLVR
ncbi:hypothetical protein FZEAL_2187 [Fusarium zealandicum]|uniref:Uncharacterized protein n=1 Tax=Fusarium zealandicum TaxID=1053134 RepID=A0A8H4XP51_9HYPO|nr:hypothetical protein FZEAL_2187 [Fusarium zealandicum]